MNFEQLHLNHALLKALKEQRYTQPTPIQEKAIPIVMQGLDLIASAQTGTGKTAAFALPILQRLEMQKKQFRGSSRPIRALILTPTRELAWQIFDNFRNYGKYLRSRYAVVFGGVSQKPQVQAIERGIDVLIATPGRLLDLMKQNIVSLDKIEIFVLDEADRMLDMGFISDIREVLGHIPSKRQTLLFSATMPKEIVQLSKSILSHPKQIAVSPVSSTVDRIAQSVYLVETANKTALLLHLLKQKNITSALVFTRTKSGADRLANELAKRKIRAQSIHGDKTQSNRQQALRDFKNGRLRVLVATDIAARGIDVLELPYVFNYDLPEIPETYVHRIGRTGRAGLNGHAIAFCTPEQKALLEEIEKLIKKKITIIEDNPYPVLKLAPQFNKQGSNKNNRYYDLKFRDYKTLGTTPHVYQKQDTLNVPRKAVYRSVDEWLENNQEHHRVIKPGKDELFDCARRNIQTNRHSLSRKTNAKRQG